METIRGVAPPDVRLSLRHGSGRSNRACHHGRTAVNTERQRKLVEPDKVNAW